MSLVNVFVLVAISQFCLVANQAKASDEWLAPISHVINATLPIDPFFNRPPNDDKKYSWSHCFSDSFQKDGWRTTSCLVRNLCFNSTSKEFLFYAKDHSQIPSNVSIGTFNYKWGGQYDTTVRFVPKVINEPLPIDRFEAPEHELWTPFLPFCSANIGHLIWDDYLTLFLLSWAARPFSPDLQLSMRPFWYNPPSNPPWATCDWIRLHEGPGHSLRAGYSDRCLKNNERWLPLLLGEGHTVLPETMKFIPKQVEVLKSEIICFPNAAYGLTSFANQGSGHHGWNPTDSIAPAFGRGPELYDFTRHMMRRLKTADVPKRSLNEIVVFLSSSSSNRININFRPHEEALNQNLGNLQKLVNDFLGHDRLRVVIKHSVLFSMTAVEQVSLASTACVYVTAAGGGAFTAQFLPRGSSIILYHHREGEHMHKGRVDWKFFNSASWMRSTYLESSASRDTKSLTDLVSKEVMNCLGFMESLNI